MSFEHCHSCKPPMRHVGCHGDCPYYQAKSPSTPRRRKKKRAKRRNAVPIGARGSLRRGAINERNEGAKRC